MKIWSEIPIEQVLPHFQFQQVDKESLLLLCAHRATFPFERRKVLRDALLRQSVGKELSSGAKDNIDLLLNDHTVAITTGHQLITAGGPWMLLYKIASTIHQARYWNSQIPSFHFVPVFWLASEDHDWTEIAQIHSVNKALSFGTMQKGAVGRVSTKEVMEALKMWNEENPDFMIPTRIMEFYQNGKDVADSFQQLIQWVFKDTELVVINPDDAALKSLFLPIMEKEILGNMSLNCLEEMGRRTGEVEVKNGNLYYLGEGDRKRIDYASDTAEFWHQRLLESPVDFSPGVVLRPLYQETILPNVIYLGGPSECRYWEQLQPLIQQQMGLAPLVMLRERGWMMETKWLRKWGDAQWSMDQWTWNDERWNQYFANRWPVWPSEEEQLSLVQTFQSWADEIAKEDATLQPFVLAEKKRLEQSIHHIQNKVLKSRKVRDDVMGNWYQKWKEQAYPTGQLQERKLYWIWSWAQGHWDIEQLIAQMDPNQSTYKIWEI